jgi:hypothetical protein
MMAKKIVGVLIITSLIISSCVFLGYDTIRQHIMNEIQGIHDSYISSTNLSDFFGASQEKLQLYHEVVQFEIKFYQNDTVNVAVYMYVSYVDRTITSNYFLLTNGTQPIMTPRSLFFIPDRKFEFVTPTMKLSIGRFWVIKLLNERQGRIRIGSYCNESHQFDVHPGDTWYLTLAVPTSSELSGFNVTIQSLNDSMEINQLTRNSDLGLFAASYNQFSGTYYAIKFGVFGGLSVCNINKEIATQTGSIIDFAIAAHRKGTATVVLPDGEVKSNNDRGYIRFMYLGNQTGNWKFTFKGWSLYYLVAAIVLYIDIDPHCRVSSGST